MNKVFSLIAFCIFSVFTVNAQTLNDKILKAISKNKDWQSFPMDDVMQVLVYGKEGSGPYLTGEKGNALIPEINNGYYRLIDRQVDDGRNIFYTIKRKDWSYFSTTKNDMVKNYKEAFKKNWNCLAKEEQEEIELFLKELKNEEI